MKKIRVLLADDHPVVRLGIKKMIERAPDISVIGEASNGIEALQMVDELKPDIILLDIEMPDIKGYEVSERLSAKNSPVRIIALSSYTQRHYIARMLASGASGYLTKDEAPDFIISAIREVANNNSQWVSKKVREILDR